MDLSGRASVEGGAAKEQQSVAAALATYQHRSAPRGQRMARARGVRDELHGEAPADPPTKAAGAVYYEMDTGEDDGSAPAPMRPAPFLEMLPQEGTRRHTGMAFELVLDPVVPQLGRGHVDVPGEEFRRLQRAIAVMEREQEGCGSGPATRCLLTWGRAAGWVEHEYEDAVTTEYVLRAGSMNSVHSKASAGYTGPGVWKRCTSTSRRR